jgi:PKD repeat protein
LSTAPSGGSFSVAVTSGANRGGLDFGSVTAATLSGTAYDDTDGDGQRDAGEAGLAGWTIFLDADGNGLLGDGERRTTSAADGSWSIGMLLPGSYTVAQVPQPGWLLTAPGPTNPTGNPTGNPTAPGSLQHTGSDQLLQLPDAGLVDVSRVAGYPSMGSNRAAQQLIGLDALRADRRFSGLDGSGLSVVVIDTGLDLDNSFFGPDANGDGVADRIVYQYDFADDDTDASDRNGHGSNIGSLIGAADGVYGGAYTGIAPGADLIALKVFRDDGQGLFSYLENALRWVVVHADQFNVGVVNLSLGDGGNWNAAIARFGLGDELAALAAHNIIVTAAAGNNFARFGGAWGVAYPAADPAVLAVGATWSADSGGPWAFGSGATDYTTGADRVASFSQRDDALLDVVAPGTGLAGANASGGISTLQGTSQASAMVAGVATLAQDLALQTLGRRLSLAEFSQLLSATSVHIVDGDDENDNVRNSGLGFQRVDVQALAEAILALSAGSGGNGGGSSGVDGGSAGGGTVPGTAAPAAHSVTVVAGQAVGGLDFGNFRLARIDGLVYEDADSDGTQDAGEGGLAGFTVYLDSNNSATFDTGEASTVTDANGRWQFSDQGPGTVTARVAPREGWRLLAEKQSLTVTSGAQLNAALTANALPTLDALAGVAVAEGSTVTVQAGGHDQAGDRLQYSLVGSLPAGAAIDADTGVFSFLAADGDASWQFTVRVTDSAGSAVERSLVVQVHDVAPTLTVTGPAKAEDGQDYVLDLAASDPGQDTVSQWTIDWGDGIVQTLAGNPSQAVHRYAQPGSYTVSASATDEDGTHTATGPTVQVSATVLQVSSFTATDTGFAVRFNRSIDPSKLNLTTAADNPMGASDIVFTDAAGKVVPGSVVVDADRRGITFVRSGGLLAAGRYELRLVSGAQAFVDATGALLDGNRDGTRGDAYVTSFQVNAGGAVLAIGDLARGPGQEINLPVGSGGMPITLTNAAGATQVAFTLRYDAALIGFVGASSGAGLPAGSTLSVDLSVAGLVRVEITTTAPLGAGTLELVRLQAGVQTAAPDGAAEVLDLTDITINGGAIAARGDDGVHVVAFLGDVDGNRAYTLQDVTRLQRLIAKADSGFGAFPLIDPLLLGDVNASGTLTSLDAARLQQQAGGTARPEFPPIPASGQGFLDQFFPVQPSLGTARVDLSQGLQPLGNTGNTGSTGSTSSTGTAGTSSWISQWLAPAQGGNVAVKVKAGSSLIKLAPRL